MYVSPSASQPVGRSASIVRSAHARPKQTGSGEQAFKLNMSPAFRKALPWPLAGNGIHHVQGGRIPIRYKPSPRLTGTTYGVGGSFFEIDFVLAVPPSLSLILPKRQHLPLRLHTVPRYEAGETVAFLTVRRPKEQRLLRNRSFYGWALTSPDSPSTVANRSRPISTGKV